MIIFIDVETSDLDERKGHLLEIAIILALDGFTEVLSKSVIVQPVGISIDEMVSTMDKKVVEMHTKNGLLDELRAGKGIRRFEAEDALVSMLVEGGADKELMGRVPVAGSTIGFDRRWLREHMPKFEGLFNYHSVDVSSFTEMMKRWFPSVYENRPKVDKAHRALADVRHSIELLKYYKSAITTNV